MRKNKSTRSSISKEEEFRGRYLYRHVPIFSEHGSDSLNRRVENVRMGDENGDVDWLALLVFVVQLEKQK